MLNPFFMNNQRIMFKLSGLIILIFCSFLSVAQNLILNGDFEEYTKCPKSTDFPGVKCFVEKSQVLKHVSNPNQGTFDFIHTCDEEDYPRYRWGEEPPQSGEGYVGIAVYQDGFFFIEGEFVQLEIKEPMKKGAIFQFEMYLSLGDKSYTAINSLGVCFSDSLVQQLKTKQLLFKPDIISYDFYENKVGWKKYTGDYIAKGGEKYIIIGNFFSKNETKANHIKILDKRQVKDNYVYYFIDNISLKQDKYLSNGITLANLNFISGSADLIKNSYSELDKLITVLQENSSYLIEINGYTDNKGEESDNLKLSEDRAQVVAEYLIEKGIDTLRIKSTGYGSKKPIADNNTPEGRLKNRRVEFVFKK